MPDEIDEILQFAPQKAQTPPPGGNEIDEIIKFAPPVGGTMGPREPAGPGAPAPAPPFPPYPGSYQGYTEPTQDPASFGTMAEASLVDDPLTKVKTFATARGLSPTEMIKRYRFAKNGEIEFKADDGSWQREIPEHLLSQAKNMGATILGHPSTYTGPAAYLAGSATGIPGAGPAAGALGAMLGEGIRKTIGYTKYDEPQTVWGNLFDIGLEGMLALGGDMAGKVVGSTINRFKTRKAPRILKRAGKEIYKGALTPEDHARAEYLKTLAEKHGITLLPHQQYDKAGMTQMWTYLRNHPLTANHIQKFDDALEKETHTAITGYIGQMGGYAEEPFAIGTKLTQKSKGAIRDAEDAIRKTAGPYYEAAFDDTPIIDTGKLKAEFEFNKQKIAKGQPKPETDVKQMVAELGRESSVPTMKIKGEPQDAYISRISKDYKRITGKDVPTTKGGEEANIGKLKKRNEDIKQILDGKPPEGAYIPTKPRTVDINPAMNEIDRILTKEVAPDSPAYNAITQIKELLEGAQGNARLIDNIKQDSIDEILGNANVKKPTRRRMTLIKKQLTAAMDEQIPDYAAGRGIYGKFGMRKPLEDLELSVIGMLSKFEKVSDVESSVAKIFGVGGDVPSYENLLRVRKVIMKEDPSLWRRTVAHYIRKQYGRAQAAQGGDVINIAGKMHQKLFGTPDKQRAMAAAFGGEKTAGYKTFKGLMEVFQRAASGKSGQSITHFAGEIKRNMAPRIEGQRLRNFLKHPYDYAVDASLDYWNDLLMRGRQEELLEALIDPGVQQRIAKIKALTPKSRRYLEAFTTLTALVATKIETQTPTGIGEAPAQLPQE